MSRLRASLAPLHPMQTQAVFTNFTCNQNCAYCNKREPVENPAFIQPRAVRARIDAAIQSGVREIVLTGGEPTLRRDIAALVQHAKSKDDVRVVLESNATLIDRQMALALRNAGVSMVRVNLSGLGESLDELTRDPGGWESALRGLHELLDVAIPVEISIAILRPTMGTVPALVEKIAEIDAGRKIVTGIVVRVPVEGPNSDVFVPWPEAAVAIVALEATARRLEIPVRMSPDAPIPPCVFPPKSRIAHLFSMTRGMRQRDGMVRAPACETCRVADACPGLPESYVARMGLPPMRPIEDDRTRRRLTIISSVREQMQREFVTPNRSTDGVYGLVEEDIIRIQFHCNQSCRFCFVSTHLPAMDHATIVAAIEDAGRRRVKITLSGGEPTLNPRLTEYVRLAASVSPYPVLLQSNAIRLDDKLLVRALVDAGLGEAFISLHGTNAELSDAITEAPGTFVRTVVGIDNLHEAGVMLTVNFVICERNMHDLPNMVKLVAQRWPKAYLNVSFVAPSSDVVPRDRAFIPRYADALPFVAEAVQEAGRIGVNIGGFESMCGIPLCLVPVSIEGYFKLDEVPPGFDRGEFVKVDACTECDLGTRCYGLRVGYRELHGESELKPVRVAQS